MYDLADCLLKNIEPAGGKKWAAAKTAPGGVPNLQMIARDVLEHWCNKSKDPPYGRKLYEVLYEILPDVAAEFQDELLSTSP